MANATIRTLAEAIRRRFAALGGIDLPTAPREPIREPPLLEDHEERRRRWVEEVRCSIEEGRRDGTLVAADKVFDRLEAKYRAMAEGSERIYVPLVDEGLKVWRPVRARRLAGDTYLILAQDYDRGIETWAFEPGTAVRCRPERRDGGPILVAYEAVEQAAAT